MSNVYESAGVDYDALDAGKRKAIEAASNTDGLLEAHGGAVVAGSRGEPAFSFTLDDRGYAFVLECLGTKSVLARRYHDETGMNLFSNVGYDAVAAIVNDLICRSSPARSHCVLLDGARIVVLAAGSFLRSGRWVGCRLLRCRRHLGRR